MGVFVKFWGTRGSIPTPGFRTQRFGGNTSCVEIRVGDTLFICDGGTGLRELGTALAQRNGGVVDAHMLFSHTHWDHIQGFPFFVPAYNPASTLRVYDVEGESARIFELLSGQMSSTYFPVRFSDLGSRIMAQRLSSTGTEIEGVKISYLTTHHPGGSLAFSLEVGDIKIVYSTDNELDQVLLNPEAFADMRKMRRFPQELVDFARGATLFIADGQYLDEEYPKKVNWGHARATTVVDLAIQAEARQTAIFHHDPMHADQDVDAKIQRCRERAQMFRSDIHVYGAREGIELKLD